MRLVLEDPVGLEDYRFKIPPQTLETLFKAELDQTPEKLRAFYAHYFADPKLELYERDVELASRVLRSGEYPRWAKASALAYLMIYEQPVRHEFHLLKPPVLLVVGEKDRTVVMRQYGDPEVVKTMGKYPELAEAAARDIPDCKLVVVPATGHVPHLERPEAFHRALVSFLKPEVHLVVGHPRAAPKLDRRREVEPANVIPAEGAQDQYLKAAVCFKEDHGL